MKTIPLLHDLKSKRSRSSYKVAYMTKSGDKKVVTIFTSSQGVADDVVQQRADFGRKLRCK